MDTFDLVSYLKILKDFVGSQMIQNKIIISLICLSFLNGCAQTALLGPAITGASTGSIYQAGLSYGTGTVIKKFIGKTTSENVKNILYVKKEKFVKKESYDEFFDTTKRLIDKKSEIKDLASQ